jgi:hypothetical protein
MGEHGGGGGDLPPERNLPSLEKYSTKYAARNKVGSEIKFIKPKKNVMNMQYGNL